MARDKVQIIYILSLLILGSLLVLFAQGVFSGLSTNYSEPIVEINRIDLFNDFLGNYSKITVAITNNDTVSHVFLINSFYDDELKKSHNVTIGANKTFQYRTNVLSERIPISQNETINSTLQVAKFVIYMDDRAEAVEEASFVFKNE